MHSLHFTRLPRQDTPPITLDLDIQPFGSVGPFRFGASIDELCIAAQELGLDHKVRSVYRWWDQPVSVAHRRERGIPVRLAVIGSEEVVVASGDGHCSLKLAVSQDDRLLEVTIGGPGRRPTMTKPVEFRPILLGVDMFAVAAEDVVTAIEEVTESSAIYPETRYNAEFPTLGVAMWRDDPPQKPVYRYAQSISAWSDWY